MILSLGLGEPQYVPDSLIGQPQDIVDLRGQAFLGCYIHDALDWEICGCFTEAPDTWHSMSDLAAELGRPAGDLLDRLYQMTQAQLLEETISFDGLGYRLTQASPEMRRLVQYVGANWRGMGCYAV